MTAPPAGYAQEICGLCRGRGHGILGLNGPCPPCTSTGKVLVFQPAIQCLKCKGSGRAKSATGRLGYDQRLCRICRGSGWINSLAL